MDLRGTIGLIVGVVGFILPFIFRFQYGYFVMLFSPAVGFLIAIAGRGLFNGRSTYRDTQATIDSGRLEQIRWYQQYDFFSKKPPV